MTKQNEELATSVFSFPLPRANVGSYQATKKLLSQLETGGCGRGRICEWVESIKASSPTSGTFNPYYNDEEYNSWVKQHPSALSKFEQITEAAKGKKVVVFLDYDGTLSPIVDDPDCAFMSDAMRAAVREVARSFTTAIVSGRGIEKVYNFVRLGELYYAGSHGMDIIGPIRGTKHTKAQAKGILFQPASGFLTMIDEVYNVLLQKTMSIPGSSVEKNKFCISVHFRRVDEKGLTIAMTIFRSISGTIALMRMHSRFCVIEDKDLVFLFQSFRNIHVLLTLSRSPWRSWTFYVVWWSGSDSLRRRTLNDVNKITNMTSDPWMFKCGKCRILYLLNHSQ